MLLFFVILLIIHPPCFSVYFFPYLTSHPSLEIVHIGTCTEILTVSATEAMRH